MNVGVFGVDIINKRPKTVRNKLAKIAYPEDIS
jgi:hypothetical protein